MAMHWFRRLLFEDDGQDLIEYALLSSFVGFAAIEGISLIRTAMNSSYTVWDARYQTDALVEVPDPK